MSLLIPLSPLLLCMFLFIYFFPVMGHIFHFLVCLVIVQWLLDTLNCMLSGAEFCIASRTVGLFLVESEVIDRLAYSFNAYFHVL